jgi:hypothetical protein
MLNLIEYKGYGFDGRTINTNFSIDARSDFIGAIGNITTTNVPIYNRKKPEVYYYQGYFIRYGTLIFTMDGWCARYK